MKRRTLLQLLGLAPAAALPIELSIIQSPAPHATARLADLETFHAKPYEWPEAALYRSLGERLGPDPQYEQKRVSEALAAPDGQVRATVRFHVTRACRTTAVDVVVPEPVFEAFESDVAGDEDYGHRTIRFRCAGLVDSVTSNVQYASERLGRGAA